MMHLLKLEFPISTLFCEGDISAAPFVSNSNRPCKLDKYRQLFICSHNEALSVVVGARLQSRLFALWNQSLRYSPNSNRLCSDCRQLLLIVKDRLWRRFWPKAAL
jgi:hypothetical protein